MHAVSHMQSVQGQFFAYEYVDVWMTLYVVDVIQHDRKLRVTHCILVLSQPFRPSPILPLAIRLQHTEKSIRNGKCVIDVVVVVAFILLWKNKFMVIINQYAIDLMS